MNDATKPWYASQAIWGGIAAIGGGLGSAIFAYLNHDIGSAIAGLTAAAGGLHAIVGRVKADTPIAKALIGADKAISGIVGAGAAS